MKTLARSASLLFLAAVVAFGQRGGFHGGFRGGGFGGFRGGGFSGFRGGGFVGFRGGGFVGFRGGGFRGFVGFRSPFFRHFGFRTVIFQRPFFGYPSFPFYGGFYGGYGGFYNGGPYDYSYAPPPSPNVIVYAAPPAAAGPEYTQYEEPARPVIVNYNFGESSTAAGAGRIYFSLALKDGTVLTALAYWVEDNTLHYIAGDGKQQTVPLDSIDRDRSLKLNRDRGVDFGLPH